MGRSWVLAGRPHLCKALVQTSVRCSCKASHQAVCAVMASLGACLLGSDVFLGPGSQVHVLGQQRVLRGQVSGHGCGSYMLGVWISCAWGMDIVCLGHGYRVLGAWISRAWGMDITCLGHGSYVFGAWISCAWGMDIMLA